MNEQQCSHGFKKYVCWKAVFAGALVAVGLSVLLNLFSIAIGLSAVTTNKEGMMVLAAGGFLGILIGVIAVMFTAGYTAGFLGRAHEARDSVGVTHGFLAWCLALIFTVILAAQIGQYVSGYAKFIAHPVAVVMNNNSAEESVDITIEKDKQANNASMTAAQTEQTANKIGHGALMIFILFFVGALASCFGGYAGVVCRTKCELKR